MKCIPLLCQVLEEEPPWFCVMNRLRHRYLLRRRETGLIYPNIHHACLALSWRRSLSYRNQSIDVLCKSIDWFLYHRDLRHERVKAKITPLEQLLKFREPLAVGTSTKKIRNVLEIYCLYTLLNDPKKSKENTSSHSNYKLNNWIIVSKKCNRLKIYTLRYDEYIK